MPRNYKSLLQRTAQLRFSGARLKDPRFFVRGILGLLLAANLVAAVMVFRPWGGSAEDLEQQLAGLRGQLEQRQASLRSLKTLVAKVEKARSEGDKFLEESFMSRRTTSSTILTEIEKTIQQVGMKAREQTFILDPVEGSDSLSMMTINGSYEGSYTALVRFVNMIDRSPRFLIIEYLQAAPQSQSVGMLNVSIKLNTFVREDGQAK